jgi:hypothetical protein
MRSVSNLWMNNKRSFIFIVFLITLSMLIAGRPVSVQAQDDSPITLKVEPGFDSYVKEARWIPVHITVENNGPTVVANLQASYKIFNASFSVFSADISLPNNSRKEFFLYVYPQGSLSSLNINLMVDDKAVVRTNVKVSNISSESHLIGLLTDDPSAFNQLSEVYAASGSARAVQLQIAQLPELPQGWEALDVLVISGVDTADFTTQQLDAMKIWIAKGGSLFITGGTEWRGNTVGIGDLLPMDVSGTTRTITAPDFQAYTHEEFPADAQMILATGTPRPGAQSMMLVDEQPLLVRKTMGQGQVLFLTADPALAPLQGWDGMQDFYDHFLNFNVPPTSWANGKWEVYSANEALSTIAELGAPSVYYICFWIVLYIVAIGPANYLVLRFIKRRDFAWVTIPGLAILFSMVAYFSGYFYRGMTPTLNRLTVIQSWDGVEQAQSHTLVGIYSPQREQYDVESADDFLLYPFNTEDTNLMGNTGWYSTQQEGKVIANNIPIEIGGMKVIAASGVLPAMQLQHDLVVEISDSIPKLTGTLTNTGPYTIKDAMLVTPGSWKHIGDLDPGETRDIDVSLAASAGGPTFYTLEAMDILGYSYMDLENNDVANRKSALLQAVIRGAYGAENMNWGIHLIGWVEESHPSATLLSEDPNLVDTTLYIHQISPGIQAGSGVLRLSPAMFRWESSSPEATPYHSYESGDDEFSLEFRPVFPIQFSTVRSLTLHLDSYNSPSQIQISLWNYELETWDIIGNVNWGRFEVPDPQKYVNSLGEVRMLVTDSQGYGVEMNNSNITLEVEQ